MSEHDAQPSNTGSDEYPTRDWQDDCFDVDGIELRQSHRQGDRIRFLFRTPQGSFWTPWTNRTNKGTDE